VFKLRLRNAFRLKLFNYNQINVALCFERILPGKYVAISIAASL